MTFSPKQLELIEVIRQVWPNYTVTDRLGTGKYGVVFLAERQDPGTDFVVREAIKVIDLRSDEDEDLADDSSFNVTYVNSIYNIYFI